MYGIVCSFVRVHLLTTQVILKKNEKFESPTDDMIEETNDDMSSPVQKQIETLGHEVKLKVQEMKLRALGLGLGLGKFHY